MTEEDAILAQISSLQDARAAIKRDHPDDLESFLELESLINRLLLRLQVLLAMPTIPPMSQKEMNDLKAAQAALETAVNQSAGVTLILQAATALVQG